MSFRYKIVVMMEENLGSKNAKQSKILLQQIFWM